ncbi:O-sialoglycoprotein endopeptidase [Methanocorpusculum labreanum Z]|uniref:Probable bifunctional tRNA threonylcarbamoyladenosine biosynthesis protein n=1 Tax=Methanocorpusculum labreanum (strain ATCC 43576 / DSM 4855 / Z) TaxID=410358 RepID=KAE1B_METLZ|nr:bifunctional N(6)-L-threonylcarbamoyladenine synthase/serine/threonine protein kinase [Methanocorpusculum labreanum]A2SR70.1 RecName: Full=Probable bifunctional tRNA threonylcarbamoyladenosine biosynthesis protein; Includes: RecName: Full=tRNA N6-adenosine threonylcarbamoyltransferase; AltName: Full=N6-L-threonylcarbamoyladenine synthase; Short=t(6)A synthase; AltName: Full=t(6)A37 threonylcarbamoyladenosine biosynthesis protein Kae1; AltName: Full=tRNA threonylcarbamoyladenosine biosynthesis p
MPEKRVLGIEGTAWNFSAAVFAEDLVCLHSAPYVPPTGGIHPREAAQHHASVASDVIRKALDEAGEKIDAVAFSIGPGLGPSLRIAATTARTLALKLGVPLIGVNHCVAHVEIGRWYTKFADPIVLYASGANTQVLGFLNGKYRIFGETLDIGLGNALDKFARSHNLPHPGGPIIEKMAKDGSYIHLPYTVKGMDLAFSGLMSAAKEATQRGESMEDVCFSFQETAFAMCVEVTERALAHTGKDEVILVGGVGANARLQEMLAKMCEERGAKFMAPPRVYMGDNGAMIAYTGKIMLEAGSTIPIAESVVNPGFRSDQVEVTWRHDAGQLFAPGQSETAERGAEASVNLTDKDVVKTRLAKGYRVPELDRHLIAERTRAEARAISAARRGGVPVPVIRDVTDHEIVMEKLDGDVLKYVMNEEYAKGAGLTVGKLHKAGITHGDLTTSNMIWHNDRVYLIDFGLSQMTEEIEPRGVDLHVLFQTLESTTENPETLKSAFINGYCAAFSEAENVIRREHEIELRGRYL